MLRNGLFALLAIIASNLFVAWFFYGEPSVPSETAAVEAVETSAAPSEWFYAQRAYPGGEIPQEVYRTETAKLKAAPQRRASGSWEFIGPTNIGGRVSTIVFHPTDTSTYYVGAASGGIFKTTDGTTFTPIFDSEGSLSIGDLAMDPTNPEILYVGTGEANAGGGSLTYEGNGVYKTIDGGATWTQLGLESTGTIGKVIVDPQDPNRIFVAAMGSLFKDDSTRGIYRSEDGGSTWEQVLYLNDSTGGVDLAINTRSGDTVFAAMWERVRRPQRRNYGGPSCGLYRSVDGGDNWTLLTSGLPGGADVGRIGVAVSASEPNIVYAQYADAIGFFDGVYKSTDGGDTWIAGGGGPITMNYSSFGWWFGKIFVDPTNSNRLYSLGLSVFRSNNGATGWGNIGGIVHVDQHAVAIHPVHSNIVLLGNDGGVYKSSNNGNDWAHVNGLPITQFYTLELDPFGPIRRYGGTQDNGTVRTVTGGTSDWEFLSGGDGMVVKVDPSDPSTIYSSFQNGGLLRSENGGSSFLSAINGLSFSDRFNWKTPYLINPQNPVSLIAGSQRVYKSTDKAYNWSPISADLTNGDPGGNLTYGTITALEMGATDSNVIYAGADDGSLNRTLDGGSNWDPISSGLPQRWVTSIAANPTNPLIVYVTFSGYRYGESLGHVFKSIDGGLNWNDISTDLPPLPVNQILLDQADPAKLFVATDAGVFYSPDDGLHWLPLTDGMPIGVVNALAYSPDSLTPKLIAATYGRSMYSYDLTELPEPPPSGIVDLDPNSNQLKVWPNPGSGPFNFGFSSGSFPPQNHVSIYSLTGKLVRELKHANQWDGRTVSGEAVSNGTYILQFEDLITGQVYTRKLQVISGRD